MQKSFSDLEYAAKKKLTRRALPGRHRQRDAVEQAAQADRAVLSDDQRFSSAKASRKIVDAFGV